MVGNPFGVTGPAFATPKGLPSPAQGRRFGAPWGRGTPGWPAAPRARWARRPPPRSTPPPASVTPRPIGPRRTPGTTLVLVDPAHPVSPVTRPPGPGGLAHAE